MPAYADAGVEPIDFPEAPTHALPIALKNAGLSVEDIALFEINEAFSVVVRIAEKVLNIDPAKINVSGYARRDSFCGTLLTYTFTVVPSLSVTLSATLVLVSSSRSYMLSSLGSTVLQVFAMA